MKHGAETRHSGLKFLFKALRLRSMASACGVSFGPHRYAQALRMLNINHKRPRPLRQEQTERPNASCSPPCGKGPTPNLSAERAAALLPFLPNDNPHRPHFGLNGKPKISRIVVNNLSTDDS
jgi:hypothetical protein